MNNTLLQCTKLKFEKIKTIPRLKHLTLPCSVHLSSSTVIFSVIKYLVELDILLLNTVVETGARIFFFFKESNSVNLGFFFKLLFEIVMLRS